MENQAEEDIVRRREVGRTSIAQSGAHLSGVEGES